MSLENEFSFDDLPTAGGSKKEKVYIDKPGGYKMSISGYFMSEDIEGHKGCPFVKFYCEASDGKMTGIKFFRSREGDSEKAATYKKERILKFLKNAGADLTAKGKAIFDSVTDKNVYVLLTNKEYVTIDTNNNNKPVVRTTIDYLFSSNSEITKIKPDMLNNSLSDKDNAKYQKELTEWEASNSSSPNVTATAGDENDMPF